MNPDEIEKEALENFFSGLNSFEEIIQHVQMVEKMTEKMNLVFSLISFGASYMSRNLSLTDEMREEISSLVELSGHRAMIAQRVLADVQAKAGELMGIPQE